MIDGKMKHRGSSEVDDSEDVETTPVDLQVEIWRRASY
jgi:hypothetical protein